MGLGVEAAAVLAKAVTGACGARLLGQQLLCGGELLLLLAQPLLQRALHRGRRVQPLLVALT